MPVLLEIDHPTHESWARGVRRFDLDEILETLRPWAEPLTWTIDDLWALAGRGQVELGPLGAARIVGLDSMSLDPACGDIAGPMTFAALTAFAACTHQVISGFFTASDDGGMRHPEAAEDEYRSYHLCAENPWFRACPVVLHACRSCAHWTTYVRDDAAAVALLERFPLQARETARW
jgi:hypothetical protein